MTGRRIRPHDDSSDRAAEVATLALRLTEVIVGVMKKEGISRAELARRMGVSPPHITMALSGERNMTLRTVAEALYELGHRLEASAVPLEQRKAVPMDAAPREAAALEAAWTIGLAERGSFDPSDLARERLTAADRWACSETRRAAPREVSVVA